MRRIKFLFWILPSLILTNITGNVSSKNTLLVCYGKLNPATVNGYNYVILESHHYNYAEIKQFKKQNKKVYAYISLGEVNIHSKLYKELKNSVLGKNNNWESYYLDLDSSQTISALMQSIQSILDKGFDGLFFDNIDNFSSYGPQVNQKKALIKLLQNINTKYPNHLFIQNSGYELVPETSTYIDALLFESIATDYSFSDKKYKLRDPKDYQTYINRLNTITKDYKLPILLLEYADTKNLYNQIIQRIKPTKFDYFIGKLDLQTIPIYK